MMWEMQLIPGLARRDERNPPKARGRWTRARGGDATRAGICKVAAAAVREREREERGFGAS